MEARGAASAKPQAEGAVSSGSARSFPWALIVSILIVAVVEIVVRTLPTRYVVPFSRRDLGIDAVTQYIDEKGSTDVAFVGSSMPLMRLML